MKRMIATALGMALILGGFGCRNILEESAQKDTDAAIFYEARKHIDAREWSLAITKLESLSDAYLAKRETQLWYASAFAGRCGLNFMDMVEALQSLSGTTLMTVLLTEMSSATATHLADCQTAEATLTAIDPDAVDRTDDENMLMAFVSLAKIGSILAVYADTDDNGGVDPLFNACSSLDDGTLAPVTTPVREIGTGLMIAYASLSQAATGIAADMTAGLAPICAAAAGLCAKTSAADFSALEVLALEGIVRTNYFGIGGVGACSDTSFATCPCGP